MKPESESKKNSLTEEMKLYLHWKYSAKTCLECSDHNLYGKKLRLFMIMNTFTTLSLHSRNFIEKLMQPYCDLEHF